MKTSRTMIKIRINLLYKTFLRIIPKTREDLLRLSDAFSKRAC
jgi:hypothetical protein